jgi:hypothetical protein
MRKRDGSPMTQAAFDKIAAGDQAPARHGYARGVGRLMKLSRRKLLSLLRGLPFIGAAVAAASPLDARIADIKRKMDATDIDAYWHASRAEYFPFVGWQLIETAPRDGRAFLAKDDSDSLSCAVVKWNPMPNSLRRHAWNRDYVWSNPKGNYWHRLESFTHWMPIAGAEPRVPSRNQAEVLRSMVEGAERVRSREQAALDLWNGTNQARGLR